MNVPKSTFYSYFDGSATPLQKKLVEEWLRQNPDHYEIFYDYLNQWECEHPQFLPDTERAFQQFIHRDEFKHEPAIDVVEKQPRRWFRLAVGTAAAVLILAGLGYWQRDFFLYERIQTAYGEVKSITLDDGTRVTLNANSVLQIPRFSRESGIRRVILNGEATFSVTHTPDHQKFIVSTPHQMEVEVLGTEFMVYSRKRGNRVVLNTGKVLVRNLRSDHMDSLLMAPGEAVTLEKSTLEKPVSHPSFEQTTAWTKHRFVFDHQSMAEIALMLHEQFGTDIQIPDESLAQRKLVGSYEATTAEDLLSTLAEMMQLKITHHQNTITLSPE